MAIVNESDAHYFLRSQSTDGSIHSQHSGLLLRHSSLPTLSRTTSAINIDQSTVEARQLREIQPLLLNRPQSEPNIQHPANNPPSNSVFINIEQPVNQNNPEIHLVDVEHVENNENLPETEERSRNIQAQRQALRQAQQIIHFSLPFVLILLAKCLYDHHEGAFNVFLLFCPFMLGDTVVIQSVKSGTKLLKLFLAALCILISFLNIYSFGFHEPEKLFLNLIFIRTYEKPFTAWDLLWFVGITDCILKLITVFLKIILTMLPEAIIVYKKRGKIYLFIEAISQLYRGLATIQPWLYYLLESYQGNEKIVGVFLAAAYMVSKGADLMTKLKLMKMAIFKLLQNVTVGSSPSKEQIQTAGEHCPICHDEYESPVLLQCRHIFCESCVTTWFDREQTCPLCRSKIVDDPSWRDGSTSFFIQLF